MASKVFINKAFHLIFGANVMEKCWRNINIYTKIIALLKKVLNFTALIHRNITTTCWYMIIIIVIDRQRSFCLFCKQFIICFQKLYVYFSALPKLCKNKCLLLMYCYYWVKIIHITVCKQLTLNLNCIYRTVHISQERKFWGEPTLLQLFCLYFLLYDIPPVRKRSN